MVMHVSNLKVNTLRYYPPGVEDLENRLRARPLYQLVRNSMQSLGKQVDMMRQNESGSCVY